MLHAFIFRYSFINNQSKSIYYFSNFILVLFSCIAFVWLNWIMYVGILLSSDFIYLNKVFHFFISCQQEKWKTQCGCAGLRVSYISLVLVLLAVCKNVLGVNNWRLFGKYLSTHLFGNPVQLMHRCCPNKRGFLDREFCVICTACPLYSLLSHYEHVNRVWVHVSMYKKGFKDF